jgi:hypothetical protein
VIGQFFLCPMGSYQVSGYLGLEFQIKGQTHYGWALVSIAAVFNGRTGSMETKLSGFAYETIPGAAIKTGQTSGADEDSAVGPEPISRDDFSAYPECLTAGEGSDEKEFEPTTEAGQDPEIVARTFIGGLASRPRPGGSDLWSVERHTIPPTRCTAQQVSLLPPSQQRRAATCNCRCTWRNSSR